MNLFGCALDQVGKDVWLCQGMEKLRFEILKAINSMNLNQIFLEGVVEKLSQKRLGQSLTAYMMSKTKSFMSWTYCGGEISSTMTILTVLDFTFSSKNSQNWT